MDFDDIQWAADKVQAVRPEGGFTEARLAQGQVTLAAAEARARPCGNAAATLTGLEIYPQADAEAGAVVETGGGFQFRAFAEFSDGTTQEVTEAARWWSDRPLTVALGPGTGRAASQLAGGASSVSVPVQAEHLGLQATSLATARAVCNAHTVDIVVAVDGTGSMLQAQGPSGRTAMECVREGVRALGRAMISGRDQAGVVRFGGVWDMIHGSSSPAKQKLATLQLPLTGEASAVLAAADQLEIITPQFTPEPPYAEGQAYRFWGATSLGGGLERAKEELESERARSSSRKVLVLITDGKENVNDPDPGTVAKAAKAAGRVVVVIGINVAADYQGTLEGLATRGHSHLLPHADNLAGILSRIPSDICRLTIISSSDS